MIEQIKEFFAKINSKGIPMPLIRDPKTGMGSVSLTLLFISSLYVQVGLIGKYSKLLEGVDVSQAINWFLIASGLYFGRTMSKNDQTKTITTDGEKKDV